MGEDTGGHKRDKGDIGGHEGTWGHMGGHTGTQRGLWDTQRGHGGHSPSGRSSKSSSSSSEPTEYSDWLSGGHRQHPRTTTPQNTPRTPKEPLTPLKETLTTPNIPCTPQTPPNLSHTPNLPPSPPPDVGQASPEPSQCLPDCPSALPICPSAPEEHPCNLLVALYPTLVLLSAPTGALRLPPVPPRLSQYLPVLTELTPSASQPPNSGTQCSQLPCTRFCPGCRYPVHRDSPQYVPESSQSVSEPSQCRPICPSALSVTPSAS